MSVDARTGRVLVTELAVAGVLIAAARGPVAGLAGALAGAAFIAAVWARLRGRTLPEWCGVALRHRRARPPAALTGPIRTVLLPPPPARLPHAHDADQPPPQHTAIDDEHGLTVLLELGDPHALITPDRRTLPHPAHLGTAAHVQVVLAMEPPRAGTTGIPAHVRALLAVRVPHRRGRDTARDLTGALRTVRAALGDLPHRPLTAPEIRRTLIELAGTSGPPAPAWRHLRTPGLVQTTFRVSGRRPPIEDLARLDAVRVTLAVSAADTLVRIDAPGEVTLPGLRRLDGEQLGALTATLPLARDQHRDDRTDRDPVPLPRDGLLLGRDRDGDPVLIRPFRPAGGVTIALVGGVRGAHLLTVRALAAGAAVVIRTDRPHAWAPLLHAADPTGAVTRLTGATGTAIHPAGARPAGTATDPVGMAGGGRPARVLEVLDHAHDHAHDHIDAHAPHRHATLLVLEELTPETAARAARADLLLLQQLPAGHAAVAERHLGLGRAAGWLTRIRPGMFAVVADRTLRWVDPAPADAELHILDHAPA